MFTLFDREKRPAVVVRSRSLNQRERERGGVFLPCNRLDWPWHCFDRLESGLSFLVPALFDQGGMKRGAPPLSLSLYRIIQWISQLCIYHYESIHLDGSLSPDDHRHFLRKHTDKEREGERERERERNGDIHTHAGGRRGKKKETGRKEESLIRMAT